MSLEGFWGEPIGHVNCTSRESVSPLSCLIRGFRNKYNGYPLGRISLRVASGIG